MEHKEKIHLIGINNKPDFECVCVLVRAFFGLHEETAYKSYYIMFFKNIKMQNFSL